MAAHPTPAEPSDLQVDDGRGDVDRYRDLARRADGPTLELACGTGRIYLELLARDSAFDSWAVARGVDGEPLTDGDVTQLRTLEKRGE